MNNETESPIHLLSGGLDQTSIGWVKSQDSLAVGFVAYGHTKCVNGVVASPDNTHFITCSLDATLKLFSTEIPSSESQLLLAENGIEGIPAISKLVSERKTKKTKHENSSSSNTHLIKGPKMTFSGHVGSVTSVSINSTAKNTFYSGGLDQSIRSWDAVTGDNVSTKVCDQAVLSIDYSALSGLIVSGHTDKYIRIWDPRIEDSNVSSMSLGGHSKYVGAVKWSPNSPYMFSSASYDGSVKVWDVRSPNSCMYNIPPSSKTAGKLNPKLLALDWNLGILAFGGESNQLYIQSF
ncbi:Ribosome biogenesis protein WDR12-like protein [Smittium mucronatum]|uniref:Ribosome biogenesis protein WDR12-like protein n=1 Tax=Smittium mucronatum TaxID=133383 RepID=A0A1R0H2J7_9FUNG|nr:Ribosome biogenesis protein WDR12-like protein [Smittium mucronatum]